MTQETRGNFVDPYECANIGNDDYTTYPVDSEGKVTAVDVIENGKLLKFITPANAQARMAKQKVDDERPEEKKPSINKKKGKKTTEETAPVAAPVADPEPTTEPNPSTDVNGD